VKFHDMSSMAFICEQVLSYDGLHSPDPLAITSAGAAL
jgi:hypothetical protein